MEESYPNRSPQRHFKHNKTGRAKKSREVHRTHTIFYIGGKKKRKEKATLVTLHSSEHHLAVKDVLNLLNLLIIVKVWKNLRVVAKKTAIISVPKVNSQSELTSSTEISQS